jgi:enamine deaminase RidA (YjgF/YER057c/UK114 family)
LNQLYELYPANSRATMPLGIRVDDTVFASVTGADPVTGLADGNVEAQLMTSINTLEGLLERGGMTFQDIERVDAYASGVSPETLSMLVTDTLAPRTKLTRIFAQPAILRSGQRLRLDVVATPNSHRQELRHIRVAANEAPMAVRIGPLLFAYDVTPVNATSGRIESEATQEQVATAFENLDRVLDTAGMARTQLLRIAGYFRDLGEKDLLNSRMVTVFPHWSQKPVHKYVPAALPPGVAFSLQAIGLMTDDRRIIEIEGIKHNDPISLGAIAGNVFISSRVQARLEPTAAEQARRLLDTHVRRLVEHLGGSIDDVTHMTWGIGNPAFAVDVATECQAVWPNEDTPHLTIVEADFPHSPMPRVEFTAVLKE